MASSMTGFARAERTSAQGKLALELKTVNHRYLEIHIRLPETLRFAEPGLRKALQQRLSRGKVEAVLHWQRATPDAGPDRINTDVLAALVHQLQAVQAVLPDGPMPDALTVLQWPGVLVSEPLNEARLQAEIDALLNEAVTLLTASRGREGAALVVTLRDRLADMARSVNELQRAEPQLQQLLYQRLQERLAKMPVEVAPDRLSQELVLLTQKADVAEELDRLQAHIVEAEQILTSDQPIGRRLDFLMQEFNREANTLGSKAAHTQYTRVAIDLKVLIEQMREQIQNIE